MIIKIFTLFIALSTLTLSPLYACSEDGKSGFMEENDMWISVNEKSTNDMTEEIFNSVLDRLETIYTPIINDLGKKLIVVRNWEDGTVNAFAQQSRNNWKITMFGGLARSSVVTADGFALVACHELGHHLGGAPKRRALFSSSWASNEGQSDYWGSMKCFRKYMELDNNQEIIADMEVPESITTKCQESFANAEDAAMCIRGGMAGMSLAALLGGMQSIDLDKLNVDTPDESVVSRTNDRHPAAQCRLDTYFAGSLCPIDHYTDVDDKDANKNVCSRKAGDTIGVRPLCWYKVPRR